MALADLHTPARPRAAPVVFAIAIFMSAALVFMVEPMISKMILPLLGGSPAVWNTCMAFFQAALLAGYVYAHLLQRYLQAKMQVIVHLFVLAGAALFLPVHVSSMLGAPSVDAPVWWLLGVMFFSIGAPFATLSATAPLLQAWYARALRGSREADNPYILYAASNLGSILALLAYPVGVEPFLALPEQGLAWGCIYSVFCLVVAIAAIHVWRARDGEDLLVDADAAETGSVVSWHTRIVWVLLAAGPSSLMLGVTTYISNDVASVPLFWVIPLALYLLTFVIAFQARPIMDSDRALLWQGACVVSAVGLLCLDATSLLAHLMVCLGALFFSALVCHQRLAASRPHPKQLTEFYLFISLGGVFGGMFNALLAPELFSSVLEYPLVLVLCCLARPWNGGGLDVRAILIAAVGVAAACAIAFVPTGPSFALLPLVFIVVSASAAALLSGRALLFTLVIGTLCAQAILVPPDRRANLLTARSFFGVHRVTLESEPALGGTLHLLFHGTTIHGAQPQAAEFRCTPTAYYARSGPIGQTFETVLAAHPQANMGVVGLGSGGLATFTLPGSRMRYFEIDPEVERIARDPRYFTFLSECAKGEVDVVLGDARLTVAREPEHSYDYLQIDAFSADNIPTHLLTTQALEIYFRALKPDGILMLHISNRNLKLEPPAAAAAKAIGATALMQEYAPEAGVPAMVAAGSQVMLISKSAAALAPFASDTRWRPAQDEGVRAWTDGYTDIIGAMIGQVLRRQ